MLCAWTTIWDSHCTPTAPSCSPTLCHYPSTAFVLFKGKDLSASPSKHQLQVSHIPAAIQTSTGDQGMVHCCFKLTLSICFLQALSIPILLPVLLPSASPQLAPCLAGLWAPPHRHSAASLAASSCTGKLVCSPWPRLTARASNHFTHIQLRVLQKKGIKLGEKRRRD